MKHLGKRGSHVEMIISFSLFILFVTSIFIFLEPTLREREEKKIIFEIIQEKIFQNISSDVTLTLISIEESYSPGTNCLELLGGGWISGETSSVKNVNNEKVNSKIEGNSLKVSWNNQRFLKIYSFPEDLSISSSPLEECSSPIENTHFFIDSIRKEKYVLESRITQLYESYESSYSILKNNLGIPIGEDFGFTFINSTGEIAIESEINTGSKSIYSKEFPILYIDSEANFALGKIILKVW